MKLHALLSGVVLAATFTTASALVVMPGNIPRTTAIWCATLAVSPHLTPAFRCRAV